MTRPHREMTIIDTLEPRCLLSVATTVAAGELTITGDAHSNSISIAKDAAGTNLIVRNGNVVIRSVASATVEKIAVSLAGGNDSLRTDASVDQPMSVTGGDGDDLIATGSGADSLNGGAGNDTLAGGLGDDTLDGGGGDDWVDYSDGPAASFVLLGDPYEMSIERRLGDEVLDRDTVVSQAQWSFRGTGGADRIDGRTAFDLLVDAGGGNDSLHLETEPISSDGRLAQVTLSGGNGNDNFGIAENDGDIVVRGGPGDDFVYDDGHLNWTPGLIDLGSGFDTVHGATLGFGPPTTLFAPAGTEKLIAGDETTLVGNELNNVLVGIPSDPCTLIGMAGNDTLIGGQAGDDLRGGSGNDVLIGNAGNDIMFGQGGNDTFYASDGEADQLDGGSGHDRAHRDNTSTVKDQVTSIESFIA